MTRAELAEFAKGTAVVAFLLLLTALWISSQRFGVCFLLLAFGWVFFGCGGGATVRLRELTARGWVFVVFGSLLVALAVVWPVVYKQPWIARLSEGIAVVASVLALHGSWLYLRAGRGADD